MKKLFFLFLLTACSSNNMSRDLNNEVLDFKYQNLDLVVPHKELASRNYVLFPLQERTATSFCFKLSINAISCS